MKTQTFLASLILGIAFVLPGQVLAAEETLQEGTLQQFPTGEPSVSKTRERTVEKPDEAAETYAVTIEKPAGIKIYTQEKPNLNPFCLDNFSFSPLDTLSFCLFPTDIPIELAEGKVLNAFYPCIAKPFPNEDDVCPNGTSIYYDNVGLYECKSDAHTPFEAQCLPGYDLIQDYSQNKPDGATADYPYNIKCKLPGFRQPTEYINRFIPCGLMGSQYGAIMAGGSGVLRNDKYCCYIFIEVDEEE